MATILNAFNPDVLEELREKVETENRGASTTEKETKFKELTERVQSNAARVFMISCSNRLLFGITA